MAQQLPRTSGTNECSRAIGVWSTGRPVRSFVRSVLGSADCVSSTVDCNLGSSFIRNYRAGAGRGTYPVCHPTEKEVRGAGYAIAIELSPGNGMDRPLDEVDVGRDIGRIPSAQHTFCCGGAGNALEKGWAPSASGSSKCLDRQFPRRSIFSVEESLRRRTAFDQSLIRDVPLETLS